MFFFLSACSDVGDETRGAGNPSISSSRCGETGDAARAETHRRTQTHTLTHTSGRTEGGDSEEESVMGAESAPRRTRQHQSAESDGPHLKHDTGRSMLRQKEAAGGLETRRAGGKNASRWAAVRRAAVAPPSSHRRGPADHKRVSEKGNKVTRSGTDRGTELWERPPVRLHQG